MVLLPSKKNLLQGIKREHEDDNDYVHDTSRKVTNVDGNASNNQHAHHHKKSKKKHQHQNPNQNQKEQKSHKQKQNSPKDNLMSGGLGDMSAGLSEPILPPTKNAPPTMPRAMKNGIGNLNGNGSGKKKNKLKGDKDVHFKGLPNSHAQNDGKIAGTESIQNGGATRLPVQTQQAILPPTSSPILPPIRSRSYSHHAPPPILPPVSPSRAPSQNIYHDITARGQTPILPPESPFRKRRGSTGAVFSGPPPLFSGTESPSPNTRPAPIPTSADPKDRPDAWEFSTGKIRTMIGNPMEKDSQREENVAFSSVYIQSPMRDSRGINVAGVNFNAIYLKCRATSILKEKGYGLKICSVAQGNVWVSLATEKFCISKGGMWRIRDAEWCSVTNQDTQECILHITSIPIASALV